MLYPHYNLTCPTVYLKNSWRVQLSLEDILLHDESPRFPSRAQWGIGQHSQQSIEEVKRVSLPTLLVASWAGKINSPCLRSRLRIESRETGSAAPSQVCPFILHTQAESGACSRDLLLPPAFFPWRRHSPSNIIAKEPDDNAAACRWC